jgi:signal transduction histidine kinase
VGLARLTLPQRLLAATTLGTGTALLIAGSTLALLEGREARRDLIVRRSTDAEMISVHAASALVFEDPVAAEQTLAALKVKADVDRGCIYGRTGALFAAYVVRGAGCAPRLPAAGGVGPGRVVLSKPVSAGGEIVGTVVIESNLEELAQRSRRILVSGVLVSALACAVGLALAWRPQRAFSRPLLALAGAAQQVRAGKDYALRVRETAPGEIGVLVESFNEMLEGIQARDRELLAAQAELEQRVAERTEELRRELEERRRADEEVRRLNSALELRLEEVTALNREIEAFSYSVSHDLRAPLRHVNGFVGLLRERAGAALDDTGRRYLDVIGKGATQMGCLIDDLLAFSRMSRAELVEGHVSLDDLLADVRAEAEREARGRAIDWRLDPLPAVLGDRSLLRVAFLNLLANAVKYTSRTREASVHVGCSRAEDGLVTVFVRDNGVGFDMRYAAKLFGVFQRLHRPEEFEGTGIGLATVRRIVNRHGGEAWAEAEPGRGATFYVSLALSEGSP